MHLTLPSLSPTKYRSQNKPQAPRAPIVMNIASSRTLNINGNKYEASENVEQTKQALEYSQVGRKELVLTNCMNLQMISLHLATV